MANERLTWKLDVDSALAKKGLDETASAGKKVAAAMDDMADAMEQALKDDKRAADALASSLGTDTVQALDKVGLSVDDMVAVLRSAGLTTEEIVADADDLAASLKRVNQVGDQIDAHLTKNLKGTADQADRSRSVMANMIGNAAQELPGVTGAFGPLNVAIGQFAEYAAEGGISLKGIAATAGPMAGVGAAVWYINSQLELMKKKDAFRKDRVKSYEDALREGGDAVSNLTDHLRELGKIETQTTFNAANPFADATRDVTDELTRAGLTVEQYTQLITGNRDGIKQWADSMRASGADGGMVADVVMILAQAHKDYDTAVENVTRSNKFFTKGMEDAADAAKRLRDGQDRVRRGHELMTDALTKNDLARGVASSFDEIAAALELVKDKQDNVTDEEAWRNLGQSIDDAKRSVSDYLAELNLPASLAVKIYTEIDQGSYAQAEADLERLGRMRNSTYFPDANSSRAAGGAVAFRPDGAEAGQVYINAINAAKRSGNPGINS